ncbi:hypothetical protein LJ739_10595 [Aestuariibacter halophilus]|uniref:PASTA domain-containing protein n=1 Tax=Fluctibacter halophilus TaxID=226011 RepID=A0ABS8GAE8_9ALTE|nr:hypothetical protein [Aestuariibacter halophilus]MCC2616689.1 hypothetical protein [Aestuariibacter halophilus]
MNEKITSEPYTPAQIAALQAMGIGMWHVFDSTSSAGVQVSETQPEAAPGSEVRKGIPASVLALRTSAEKTPPVAPSEPSAAVDAPEQGQASPVLEVTGKIVIVAEQPSSLPRWLADVFALLQLEEADWLFDTSDASAHYPGARMVWQNSDNIRLSDGRLSLPLTTTLTGAQKCALWDCIGPLLP